MVEGDFCFYLLLGAVLAAARRLRNISLPLMTLNYKIKFKTDQNIQHLAYAKKGALEALEAPDATEDALEPSVSSPLVLFGWSLDQKLNV